MLGHDEADFNEYYEDEALRSTMMPFSCSCAREHGKYFMWSLEAPGNLSIIIISVLLLHETATPFVVFHEAPWKASLMEHPDVLRMRRGLATTPWYFMEHVMELHGTACGVLHEVYLHISFEPPDNVKM